MAVHRRNAGGMKGTSAAEKAAAFDCNICLDAACDPLVTFCGHLYCWPCLYKWSRARPDGPLRCPVCKAGLPDMSVVPLYGSGKAPTKARPVSSFKVPPRPPAGPTPCPQGRHRVDSWDNNGGPSRREVRENGVGHGVRE